MNTATQNAFQKRPKLLLFIGYGLATICLVWVLHDFHIVQELKNLANVSWEWVLIGMGCDVLSYVIQALRWKFLLAPFGKVRLSRSIRAVFAGLFANLVFPLRPGEVLRSYLLANSEEITIGRVLGAVGVERFSAMHLISDLTVGEYAGYQAVRAHPSRKDNRTERRGLSRFRSTKTTLCQVPSCSSPPCTGSVTDGATMAGST